jgi:hypothetical protein
MGDFPSKMWILTSIAAIKDKDQMEEGAGAS